jgi:hypothetical protein
MTLDQIKRLIIEQNYDYSEKVREFMEAGWFCNEDLERCILSATDFCKIENDELNTSVDGKKYVILGIDGCGCDFYTCGKVKKDDTGRFYFFITAHPQDK